MLEAFVNFLQQFVFSLFKMVEHVKNVCMLFRPWVLVKCRMSYRES